MTTRLIWIIWTSLSAFPRRLFNLSLLSFLPPIQNDFLYEFYSVNGVSFLYTCRQFTYHHPQEAINAEHWYFIRCTSRQSVLQTADVVYTVSDRKGNCCPRESVPNLKTLKPGQNGAYFAVDNSKFISNRKRVAIACILVIVCASMIRYHRNKQGCENLANSSQRLTVLGLFLLIHISLKPNINKK